MATSITGDRLNSLKASVSRMTDGALGTWLLELQGDLHNLTKDGGSYDQFRAARDNMVRHAGGMDKLTPQQKQWRKSETDRMTILIADVRRQIAVVKGEVNIRQRRVGAVKSVLDGRDNRLKGGR